MQDGEVRYMGLPCNEPPRLPLEQYKHFRARTETVPETVHALKCLYCSTDVFRVPQVSDEISCIPTFDI